MGRSHGDRADNSDKLRVLKKQIDSHKREILRLRKELNRANQRIEELLSAGLDVAEEKVKKTKDALACEKCGEGVYKAFPVTIAGVEKVYLNCSHCGHRKQK